MRIFLYVAHLYFMERQETAIVADLGCLSRVPEPYFLHPRIPDPDFYPSRIPDLGSRIQQQLQKRGVEKNFVVIPFFIAINLTKL
jgi:hypothetical protein